MFVVTDKKRGKSDVAAAFALLGRGEAAQPAPKLAKVKGKGSSVLRADAYLRLVATVPCRYPGCTAKAPSQACHLNQGKGKAMKVSDAKVAAGCPAHHRELDQGKDLSREDRRSILALMVIDTFDYLMARGKIGLVEEKP